MAMPLTMEMQQLSELVLGQIPMPRVLPMDLPLPAPLLLFFLSHRVHVERSLGGWQRWGSRISWQMQRDLNSVATTGAGAAAAGKNEVVAVFLVLCPCHWATENFTSLSPFRNICQRKTLQVLHSAGENQGEKTEDCRKT